EGAAGCGDRCVAGRPALEVAGGVECPFVYGGDGERASRGGAVGVIGFYVLFAGRKECYPGEDAGEEQGCDPILVFFHSSGFVVALSKRRARGLAARRVQWGCFLT